MVTFVRIAVGAVVLGLFPAAGATGRRAGRLAPHRRAGRCCGWRSRCRCTRSPSSTSRRVSPACWAPRSRCSPRHYVGAVLHGHVPGPGCTPSASGWGAWGHRAARPAGVGRRRAARRWAWLLVVVACASYGLAFNVAVPLVQALRLHAGVLAGAPGVGALHPARRSWASATRGRSAGRRSGTPT